MLVVMAEQDSLYHKVIDDLYEQVVDHDRPRGSQFDYCEDITEQYIDKMSDIELEYWYDTYIAPFRGLHKETQHNERQRPNRYDSSRQSHQRCR
jgi:hypothetical protein